MHFTIHQVFKLRIAIHTQFMMLLVPAHNIQNGSIHEENQGHGLSLWNANFIWFGNYHYVTLLMFRHSLECCYTLVILHAQTKSINLWS